MPLNLMIKIFGVGNFSLFFSLFIFFAVVVGSSYDYLVYSISSFGHQDVFSCIVYVSFNVDYGAFEGCMIAFMGCLCLVMFCKRVNESF